MRPRRRLERPAQGSAHGAPRQRPLPLRPHAPHAAWGEMTEDAEIAYIAASAQDMMSESYNFT